MREIKYRGFDAENKCWRFGWYTRLQDGCRKYDAIICDEDGTLTRYYIHDDDTIGQFTGIIDKNCVKVYEGDICNVTYHDSTCIKLSVIWDEYGHRYMLQPIEGIPHSFFANVGFEVIGNIHEEPTCS